MQGGAQISGLSPVVVPVFVSHLGCPHRCVFCDQTQFAEPASPDQVSGLVSAFIAGCRNPGERQRILAFYGGSFTGIRERLLEGYLREAHRLVEEGVIHGVKASTRPDMVTEENLARCRDAGFVEMEIGGQSMDERVLDASLRGHSADDTRRAARLIRDSGLRLGIQIMPGLPGEDRTSWRRTVDCVLDLRPDTVRLYPTVVMEGTGLEHRWRAGSYEALSLDEAVLRCLYGYARFREAGCRVLRMGLPPSGRLRIAAGPYHPSFGFLVKSRGFHLMAQVLMERFGRGLHLEVNPDCVSELLGHRRENVRALGFSYSFDDKLPRDYVQLGGGQERGCLQLKDIIEYIL